MNCRSYTLRGQSTTPIVALFLAVAACASGSGAQRAPDSGGYIGAEQALAKVAAARPAPMPSEITPPDPNPSRTIEPELRARLRRELATIRSRYASRTPEQAAETWLRLVDRYAAFARKYGGEGAEAEESYLDKNKFSFQQVLKALPPPSAWRALAARIKVRAAHAPPTSTLEGSLRLLAHLLTAGTMTGAQWKDVAALERAAAGHGSRAAERAGAIAKLRRALAERTGDPARILEALERFGTLKPTDRQDRPLDLPDLVPLVGPQKAEALLKRLLLTSPFPLSVNEDSAATLKLARRLALALGPRVKTASWLLMRGIDSDSMRLFEETEKRELATRAKLPRDQRDSYWPFEYERARYFYALGLLARGRLQEAAKVAAERLEWRYYAADDAIAALENAGYGTVLFDFMHAQLSARPTLPYWEKYIEVASRQHRSEQAIALLRSALAKPVLDTRLRSKLQEHLTKALLASDRVEEAVEELRKGMAPREPFSETAWERLQTGMTLARLGRLLHNPVWEEEGIRGAAAIKAGRLELADFYMELGRGPEAEKILIEVFVDNISGKGPPVSHSREHNTQQLLIQLLSLYSHADRHKDVLLLLDRARDWYVKDISSIYLKEDRYGSDRLVGWMVARTLAATGRAAEAVPILKAILVRKMDYDPAYQLLVDLQGVAAIPFLDRLAATDRFEERPLIWKAYALFTAKRLVEAERVARAAIAIDPSDGEQGKDRRLRVYSILADIRAARGDADQAALYRNVVQAIRIAENADELHEAGLLERSVRRYEEALRLFSDAYCIQSRLAVKLAEEGKMQEAETHYQRAYELMPDSFGRMESHCFGCEHVFKGARAEGIAERTFKRLLAKSPDKPQLHYLLGYLREQQGRWAEALALYRQAVRLDPDYINAWKHIEGLADKTHMRASERDTATLRLLRLDPQQKHNTVELTGITDLASLWRTAEIGHTYQPPPVPKRLYPLAASKAVVDKEEAERRARDPDYDPEDYVPRENIRVLNLTERTLTSPGQFLAAYSVLSLLAPVVHSGFP